MSGATRPMWVTAQGLEHPERIRVWNALPIIVIHLLVVAVVWVGFSWVALAVAASLYVVRMFVITAFYHRYFSHRTFSTSRAMQAIAGVLGTMTAQRGPLWWAAHHRDHHRHSDHDPDIHSPLRQPLGWSHIGWFLSDAGVVANRRAVPDLTRYPELRVIDDWHMIGPFALVGMMFALGWCLDRLWPGLGTSGPQMVVWGFAISTVVLYHATFTINSLAHTWGRRRFRTDDDSRNNFWLALLTFGEGWHNNHHYFPGTVRQGFYWWEIDLTYYVLVAMSKVGLVWDLRRVPAHVYDVAARRAAV
ncbi:MAG: acyl-CoA desaturase [Phycisphaerae bacterium]|nr:acyl-CoA desaturase [Phycisphaerae bacterium]